jgi:hypothetical protein
MIINVVWLIAQVAITSKVLKKKNVYFIPPWILINFNTLAFLTIFILSSPNVLSGSNSIDDDFWLNFLILFILAARTVIDYYVGWKSLYNKRPKKKPEDMLRVSSYLHDKGKMTDAQLNHLRETVAKKFYGAA